MKYAVLLVAAAAGALASLNCTTTAPIKTYCCPDSKSELVKELPEGALIMLGCAADGTDKEYYWNYNGLYTPYTSDVVTCNLNGMRFDDMTVLPDCEDDTFVLQYTHENGGSGPLDKCNPNCMSEKDFPKDVYFGDTQLGVNLAKDFITPEPTILPGFGGGSDENGDDDGEDENVEPDEPETPEPEEPKPEEPEPEEPEMPEPEPEKPED